MLLRKIVDDVENKTIRGERNALFGDTTVSLRDTVEVLNDPNKRLQNRKVQRFVGFRLGIQGFYIHEGTELDSNCRASGSWNSSGRVEPMAASSSLRENGPM